MAVLIEAISVIIKRTVIEEKYPDGWEGFVNDVPNKTLCADDKLVRIGFMTPEDVEVYIQKLNGHGIRYIKNNSAIDLVVVEQLKGPLISADWLDYGHIDLESDGNHKVTTCRFVGDQDNTLMTPDGWQFEGSISHTFGFVPTGKEDKSLVFLRNENGMDIYLNKLTGKEVFIGRPNLDE